MTYSIYNFKLLTETSYSVILPFSGGAFFSDITNVATAFNTNDISDNLYLRKDKTKTIQSEPFFLKII
jgi:hypothetical protein